MKPHPRIRKTAKWGALVLGVVLVAAGAVSTVRTFGCIWYVRPRERSAGIYNGQLYLRTRSRLVTFPWDSDVGTWYFQRLPRAGIRWWPWRVTNGSYVAVYIPLWMPALASFGVGGALWRWDVIATRRARAGFCPACSYDRAGIAVTAPCPECGKAVV